MRVVFLTWRDTTHPDGGGSEVYVEEVARELAARGHEVLVRCARHPGAARTEQLGAVTLRRSGGRLTVYPRALLWLLGPGRSFDAVVDVVNGLPFATPLVRRRGVVALVHHVHREQWRIIYPGLKGRVGWFVEGRVVPLLYRRVPFLTVSDPSRRDLASLGLDGTGISVARNGLDARPVDEPLSPTPRLVVLARLVPHKQIDHAFAVVAALREELPEVHLDLVGEGWWRGPLEAEVRRRRLGDAVTFHGHVDRDTRDRLLARAWAMVLPSVKEGWGLAISEAGAQGTPAVAYRSAGGPTEAIDDGASGLLADDLAGLTAGVRRLLTDSDLRNALGAGARNKALASAWSATAETVETVLLKRVDLGGGQDP